VIPDQDILENRVMAMRELPWHRSLTGAWEEYKKINEERYDT
jgi:hypothetical protein